MRSWLAVPLLVLSGSVLLPAEEVALHRCKVTLEKKPKMKRDSNELYEVGEKVGVIETGPNTLSKIHGAAMKRDASSDPFFGPGHRYVAITPDGSRFAIFFEYKPGDKTFNGSRFAIGKLSSSSKEKNQWKGDVFEGSSFEKTITAQLKKLTDAKPEKSQ